MDTLSFLIKAVGNYNLYIVQNKKTVADDATMSVSTKIVDEKIFHSLDEALECLENIGVRKSELDVTMEFFSKYEHNHASFGIIDRGLVLTNYVGSLS